MLHLLKICLNFSLYKGSLYPRQLWLAKGFLGVCWGAACAWHFLCKMKATRRRRLQASAELEAAIAAHPHDFTKVQSCNSPVGKGPDLVKRGSVRSETLVCVTSKLVKCEVLQKFRQNQTSATTITTQEIARHFATCETLVQNCKKTVERCVLTY